MFRHTFIGLFSTALLLGVLPLAGARAGGGKAVLVGIDYTGSANALDGCEGDARSTALTLVRQFDFAERDVALLLGERATKANIAAAIREIGGGTAPDDLFVFFYSGHGSSLPDDNGDEADGEDETICPYDIVLRSGPDSFMRDDEIGALLDAVPARHQLVILDSCHAGTGTRNLTRCAREKSVPRTGTRSAARPFDPQQYRELHRKGGEILIAGCASTELSQVIRVPVGSRTFSASALTFFLNQGLRGAADDDGDGRISYAELVSYTQRGIDGYFQSRAIDEPVPVALRLGPVGKAAVQSVQLEGVSGDAPVLDGRPLRPFYALVTDTDGNRVQIDAGAVHGYRAGTVLNVVGDSGQRLGQIEITTLAAEESIARVLDGAPETWRGSKAFVEGVPLPEPPPAPEPELTPMPQVPPSAPPPAPEATPALVGTRRLAVRLVARDRAASAQVAEALAATLRGEAFLDFVAQDDAAVDVAVILAATQSAGRWQVESALQRRSGQITDPLTAQGASLEQVIGNLRPGLVERLAMLHAATLIAEITNPCPGFAVELTTDRGDTRPAYRIGERFSVTVRSSRDCYVTLIDLGTSGSVSVLYPPGAAAPVRLPAGEPLQLPPRGAFAVSGPAGTDVLKLIATTEPLPLTDLVQKSAGRSHGGVLAGVIRALRTARGVKGSHSLTIPTSAWAECTLSVTIAP